MSLLVKHIVFFFSNNLWKSIFDGAQNISRDSVRVLDEDLLANVLSIYGELV